MTIPLNPIPEFNNIHLRFENRDDFRKFLEGLPDDRYPPSELERLRLVEKLKEWLELNGEDCRAFFGLTFLNPVGQRDNWTRATLFRCRAIRTPDGNIEAFKSPFMSFELDGAYS